MASPKMMIAAALIAMGVAVTADVASAQAHRHIGHVADGWNDTPDGVGLLVAAQAEAEVAAQHAGLAAQAGDLSGVQTHTRHVVHALNPEMIERGPGKGYGLIKAAGGAAQHIELAARADDASDAVKTHANHVATSARNAVTWSEAVLAKAHEILNATDAANAKALAAEVADMTQAILQGTDADGNGRVSWDVGEGGLAQSATHVRLMKEAEGLD